MSEQTQERTHDARSTDVRIQFSSTQALDSLSAYGMEWIEAPIAKGKGASKRILRAKAPMVRCTDLDKMRQTFGDGFVKEALNGSSITVQVQGIVRRQIEKNPNISNQDVRKAVIASVFMNIRTRSAQVVTVTVTVTKVQGQDGKMYESEKEAAEAFTASQADKLAKMVDAGMDAALARSILGI